MRATSDGQYVDFNIHVIIKEMEGVGENTTSFMAYPNPTSGALTLFVADAQRFDYEVYNIIGQSVMQGAAVGEEAVLDLGDLKKGLYFISVEWEGTRLMQKVILK